MKLTPKSRLDKKNQFPSPLQIRSLLVAEIWIYEDPRKT